MDYPEYYKLALRETYGGEFPGMSDGEFDRRCSLPRVPEALKALYLALGCTRFCRMHLMIPAPEELHDDGHVVIFARTGERVFAIASADIEQENPLVHAVVDRKEDENGGMISIFGHDGETRVALHLANLIALSAGETRDCQKSVYPGMLNRLQNSLIWLTRQRWRLMTLLAMVVVILFCQTRIAIVLNTLSPVLGVLAVFFLLCMIAVPVGTLDRMYFLWNVWLDLNDNVRFAVFNDRLVGLIRDLSFCYLRWNQPEIWLVRGAAVASLNSEIGLREGSRRFCQLRYDFISDREGKLLLPGLQETPYSAGKPVSLLMRSTLDDSGCIVFTYVNANCRWRLPKPQKVKLAPPEGSKMA